MISQRSERSFFTYEERILTSWSALPGKVAPRYSAHKGLSMKARGWKGSRGSIVEAEWNCTTMPNVGVSSRSRYHQTEPFTRDPCWFEGSPRAHKWWWGHPTTNTSSGMKANRHQSPFPRACGRYCPPRPTVAGWTTQPQDRSGGRVEVWRKYAGGHTPVSWQLQSTSRRSWVWRAASCSGLWSSRHYLYSQEYRSATVCHVHLGQKKQDETCLWRGRANEKWRWGGLLAGQLASNPKREGNATCPS